MSKPVDLSLVPLDDLVKELEGRTETLVLAYTVKDPQDKDLDWFWYGKGSRWKAVQLSADLQNDVLNNWDGALQTLQRLNDEEDDD